MFKAVRQKSDKSATRVQIRSLDATAEHQCCLPLHGRANASVSCQHFAVRLQKAQRGDPGLKIKAAGLEHPSCAPPEQQTARKPQLRLEASDLDAGVRSRGVSRGQSQLVVKLRKCSSANQRHSIADGVREGVRT